MRVVACTRFLHYDEIKLKAAFKERLNWVSYDFQSQGVHIFFSGRNNYSVGEIRLDIIFTFVQVPSQLK